MIPLPVQHYLRERALGQVTRAEATGGGCISNGRVLTATNGARYFLKTHPSAPPGLFAREAEGLAALAAAPSAPRVPTAHLVGDDFLLLEYLQPAAPAASYWPALGARLARLHSVTSERFGFEHDNYIGLTPQPNTWHADGYNFFAEQRLLPMGRMCHAGGLLDAGRLRQLERVAARLPELVPAQPASLLHGDLWSGNIIPGPGGEACLIDPAAHYGWAEADLAMTTLFGQPPESFFEGYASLRPLVPGYRARVGVYNLYHLLNHLGLFGGGYAEAVNAVLDRYTR